MAAVRYAACILACCCYGAGDGSCPCQQLSFPFLLDTAIALLHVLGSRLVDCVPPAILQVQVKVQLTLLVL